MQKAIELENQINDLKKAIKKSNSNHLKNDYAKAIRRKRVAILLHEQENQLFKIKGE